MIYGCAAAADACGWSSTDLRQLGTSHVTAGRSRRLDSWNAGRMYVYVCVCVNYWRFTMHHLSPSSSVVFFISVRWRGSIMVRAFDLRTKRFDSRSGRCQVVTTWTGDCLRTGKPSRYITSHPGQLSLLPCLPGWGACRRRCCCLEYFTILQLQFP